MKNTVLEDETTHTFDVLSKKIIFSSSRTFDIASFWKILER
jgi:hypothetical protein